WTLARSNRPCRQQLPRPRVDVDDLALVLDIAVDIPLAVCHRKLRLSWQFQRPQHFVIFCINHSYIMTAAVKCPNRPRDRLVQNPIRIRPRWNGVDHLIRLAIENRHLVAPSVTDVTASARSENDSVGPMQTGDVR